MSKLRGLVRERLPQIFCALAIVWCVIVVVTFSDAGVPFPTWLVVAFSGLGLLVCSVIGLGVTYALARRETSGWTRRNLRPWVFTFAVIIAGIALANTSQLLSIRLFLSARALQQSGPVLGTVPQEILYERGRWVGLFRVREFSQFGSELRFITNDCGLLDNCGIVFSPDGPPPHRGEDSFAHLYGPWWHWYQSF